METNYKPPSSKNRSPRRFALALITAAASGAFLSCTAEVTSEDPSPQDDTAGEAAEVAAVGEALSVPLTLSSFNFCAAVKKVGEYITQHVQTPNLTVDQLSCDSEKVTNLFYNGAELSTGGLADLKILPYVTSGAYYCALKEASGAKVSAFSGPFGISSQFDVTLANPATVAAGNVAEIKARRTGTVVLFGVPFRTHVQDMIWRFPFEWDHNSIPPLYGTYMSVLTDADFWDLDLTATIPVGPFLIKLRPQMHQRIGQGSYTNNAIQFSPQLETVPPGRTNMLNPVFDYAAWDKCRMNPSATCPHPQLAVADDLLQLQHQFGPCLGANVGNFNDDALPYVGPFGGAGRAGCYYQNGRPDFIFLDSLKNWFHFGKPSIAAGSNLGLAEGEVKHNITRADVNVNYNKNEGMQEASFTAGITASGTFDFGFVKTFLETTASMAARDGFAVRQQHLQPVDDSAHTVRVYTDLNAQTRTDLTIHANLKFPAFPLLPDIDAMFTIPTGNTNNVETDKVPSLITYFDREMQDGTTSPKGFQSYQVRGTPAADPEQARINCFLPSTATKGTLIEPEDPAQRVIDLATGAVDMVHPCNVKKCTNSFGETDQQWDHDTHQLKAAGTKNFCSICANVQMHLCKSEPDLDANGVQKKDAAGKLLWKETVLFANPTAQHPEGSPVFMKQGALPAAPGHSCLTGQ